MFLQITDAQFLEIYFKILDLNPHATYQVVVNTEYQTIYCNDLYLEFLNLPREKVLNNWLKDMPTPLHKYGPITKERSDQVLSKKLENDRSLLPIRFISGEQGLLDVYISRLTNPFTSTVFGLTYTINEAWVKNQLAETFLNIFSIVENKKIEDTIHYVQLDELEHEILLLLLVGKPYKEIAYNLSILHNKSYAPTTISSIVYRNLYDKFKVQTLPDLIEKFLQTDMVHILPRSFIIKHHAA